MHALHQELLGLRRRHRWLHAARTRVLEVTGEHLVYESAGEGGRLVVALSVGAQPAVVRTPGATALLAGNAERVDGGVRLPAAGWAVLTG